MSGIGHNSSLDNVSAEQLRLLIERVERLKEERKGINDDIKDVYGEARSQGFDIKAMRFAEQQRAMEKHHRDERRMVTDTYLNALGLL